ncbi:unnamed protein product [Clonostachys rosea f. rosea IK726]|uniref:Uncharacterized protein n=1 Tax=Clonostachys rosea f. rosea IK726 TaxID=1349383 RepID=A0ACA9TJA1_BIOOC|nr:unnamed protein product [Clonostachys rosea f. rosea IK726]
MNMMKWALGSALLALPQLASAQPTNHTKPLVKDKALQDAITVENLYKHAEKLQAIAYSTPGRNRVAGSTGHDLTVEYISEQLNALGGYYDVQLQPWEGLSQQYGEISFTVNGAVYDAKVVEFSSNVTATDVPLVVVPNLGCDAADFPSTVSGSVALVHRGSCTFALKSQNAKSAGAVGVIFWNNENAGVVSGTYGEVLDNAVPGGGISQADGEALVALSGNTTLTTSLEIATVIELVQSWASDNVIATSKYGNPDNVLFLGAHSDSVAEGPGINDDGSGTIGLLETAIQLAKYSTKAQIKFGWWTAEESGLLGSTYYVESLSAEELLKIRLYLNFDMIASPNYILGHYDGDGSEFGEAGPAGSAEAEHFFEDYYESNGLNHTATEFNGRSDYGPFLDAGVPCGGLDAGADEPKTQEWVDKFGGTLGAILDPNYHTAQDDVNNLNKTCFGIMSKGIAHAVAYYGASGFEGFPERNTTAKRSVGEGTKAKPTHKYPYRFPTVL